MTGTPPAAELWQEWARRWRLFQEAYVPDRERQLAVMADYVALGANGPVRLVLDLGSGPGSATDAVLRRCPQARAVAVDLDPFLVELGRRTAETADRIDWVQADLRDPGWSRAVPAGPYDAVVTATALHWLSDPELAVVYAGAARLLAPRGMLLVGDAVSLEAPRLERLTRAAAAAHERAAGGSWNDFWRAARAVGDFASLIDERDRRLLPRRPLTGRTLATHAAAMREAGFAEVAEVWRVHEAAVIAAMR